jgi:transcription initiation factor TFIIIB Brf1 subunit/transcription initiation factor TFIIB
MSKIHDDLFLKLSSESEDLIISDKTLSDDQMDLLFDQIDSMLLGINIDKKEPDKNKCIACSSENLVIDNLKGYLVCEDCATINEEFIDKNQEFNNENSNSSRYGCPSNYFCPKSALGTKMICRGYNRAAILQRQGQMPYKEKSLLEVLERIQNKCKEYCITQTIIDGAKILYKKINDCKHDKGKNKGKNIIMRCINRRSMIAACVFYASKLQKEPRSPKEIADIYDLEIKNLNKGCKNFLELIDFANIFQDIKSDQASDFIDRFGKKLNIEKQYIDIARDMAINIHKLNIASRHEPTSVAAGCFYLLSKKYKLDLTKKQISEVFGISEVTILKTDRKIQNNWQIISNNKVVEIMLQEKEKMNLNKKQNIKIDNDVFKTPLEEPEVKVKSKRGRKPKNLNTNI